MLTASQNDRITSLQDQLRKIAYSIAYSHYRADVDEMAQDLIAEMNLYIAERAAQDPTYLDQEDNYVTRAAGWHARDYARRERYGRNLQPQLMDAETEDGVLFAETLAGDETDNDLVIAIQEALAELGEIAAQVAQMILEGYRNKDIAEALNVKPPTVYWYRKQIAEVLAPIYKVL